MQSLNVDENRATPSWSRTEMLGRVAWAAVRPLFFLSPRPMWGWRRFLLRVFGAEVGSNVHIYPSVKVSIPWNVKIGDGSAVGARATLYALGPINIGERVTISQGAHICAGTHDWRQAHRPLLKPPINIEDDAWVAADAFIGPFVNVGSCAIVGARAVVTKDVPNSVIVVGNPAKQIRGTQHD